MGKVKRPFCSHQNFVHNSLSAPGLYTCGKNIKKVYTIIIQRDLFETCNKFVPKGFSALDPGAIYMYKIIKNVYEIRFKRDHFETFNIWAKKKVLSIVIKFLSPMVFSPAWGYI